MILTAYDDESKSNRPIKNIFKEFKNNRTLIYSNNSPGTFLLDNTFANIKRVQVLTNMVA